jgi:hypothetical protein
MTSPRAQDPAEGSREIVNHELARTPAKTSPATAADVERLLGQLEAAQVTAILMLDPNLSELEQAAAWSNGDGDRLAGAGRPLEGKVAAIVDILDREDEEP